jgi:uncharacterized YccA/Bax inhibitor family protein
MLEPNPALRAIDDIDPSIFDSLDTPETQSLQFPDVLARFAGLFVAVLAGAVIGWNFFDPSVTASSGFTVIYIIGLFALVGVAIGVARTLAKGNTAVGVPLAFVYAVGQGAYLGFISAYFDLAFGDGIIQQTVLATTVTVIAVIGFSATSLGKRSGRAVRFFVPVVIGYLIFMVVNLLAAAIFGVGDGWGFGGAGPLGILLSLFGVALASWAVNIDVVAVTDTLGREVHRGIPWALAFGLVVSILWLYLEILRLLGRARS